MKNTQLLFSPEFFTAEPGTHRNKAVIWISFNKGNDKINLLKAITKPKFSSSQKMWYVADTSVNRDLFKLEPKLVGKYVMQKIHDINLPALQRFQEHIVLMGYSRNTMRTYCTEFAQLLYILKDVPAETLSVEKLRSYILFCHRDLQLSENQIHSRMNALKFYFEKVLRREKIFLEIPRPKKPQLLPKALSQDEIKRIIGATENIKHRLIIELAYGMGLRVSEIVNLKLEDINSKKMTVFISKAKGKKDRYLNLPISALEQLRTYYKEYLPKKYLFEGQHGGQYSVRSAQAVFKNAMRKAGIHRTVGIHALRHSYATHLLECGTDIRIIKELLGHNSLKTTEIYTQVTDLQKSRVRSPLDDL